MLTTEPPSRLTIARSHGNGDVCLQQNLLHTWQLHGLVARLNPRLVCEFCTRENPVDLTKQQVLLLRIWYWRSLNLCHVSLPHIIHMKQEFKVWPHNAFWNYQIEHCSSLTFLKNLPCLCYFVWLVYRSPVDIRMMCFLSFEKTPYATFLS